MPGLIEAIFRWDFIEENERMALVERVSEVIPREFEFLRLSGRSALYRFRDLEFVLLPGGEMELGFDADNFTPDEDDLEDYRRAAKHNSLPEDIRDFMRRQMTALRKVTIAPFLIQTKPDDYYEVPEDEDWEDDISQLEKQLELPEFRLPTSDEWEYACKAKARGLTIAAHPEKKPELVRGMILRGGDGGAFSCGGFPGFFRSLPRKPAWREPIDYIETEELLYRRVLSLDGLL